ncbi:MAG: T9SS type A sorting domain-containing protein [Bacteroidetes bacterium]|nr:T9SS type A sorting domain-containing protein [Bacteroidota bacterium]
MKTNLKNSLVLLGILLFSTTVFAGTVTVTVKKSDGTTALPGVSISYFDGYWKGLGSTNGSGQVTATIPDNTWNFRAEYAGSTSTQSGVVVSGSTAVNFQTVLAAVQVNNSSGAALSGASVEYLSGYWRGIGTSNGSGQVSCELFAGSTFPFRASYGGSTSANQTMDLSSGGNSLTFSTVLAAVQVNNSSGAGLSGASVEYLAGYWRGIGTSNGSGQVSCQLFPGSTYPFRASYGGSTSANQTMDLSSGGNSLTFATVLAAVQVNKHNGDPLSGASLEYLAGYWRGIGTSNGSGQAGCQLFPGSTYPFRANYGGTTSANQTMDLTSGGNSLTYYTALVTVNVKSCSGTNISGASAEYLAGYWRGIGTTNGSGQVTCQLFGGNTDFRVSIGGTTSANNTVAIPGNGSTSGQSVSVTFNPTQVTITGVTGMQYLAGYWRGFSGTIYLFPGTYSFKLSGFEVSVAVSGCSINKKGVIVRLLNSSGSGIAGGVVDAYVSSWTNSVATTNSSGNSLVLFDGSVTNAYFRMNWANASQQLGSYNINTTTTILFQTKNVTVELRNGAGNLYNNEGTNVGYYASNWNTFGSGTTSGGKCNMELLPVNYYFRMTYLSQQQQQGSINIASLGANPTITFSTVTVTLRLNDAAGTGTHEATALGYYTNNWYTFGTGVTNGSGEASVELLPGNYYFRMTYANQSQQKGSMNISVNTTVNFYTVLVTLNLKDYNGNSGVLEGNSLGYYTNTWHTFGSGNTTGGSESMELLPGNYYFRMAYSNMSQQKGSMNISANTTVPFQTVLVTQTLKDNSNNPISGAAAGYYSNTWHNFGTTDANGEVSKELLPGNYYFNMTYNSYTKQKGSYNVNGALTVPYTYTGSGITRVASNSTDPIMEKMAGADAKVDGTANTRGLEGAAAQTASTAKVNVVSQFTAYPNPFNTVANINYTLSSSQNVRMEVYNAKGINVKTLVNGNMPAGSHTAQFEAANLSEGVYYVRLFTDKGTSQVPVILTK